LLELEYREYLNQTIYILEDDPEFRKFVANLSTEEVQVHSLLCLFSRQLSSVAQLTHFGIQLIVVIESALRCKVSFDV